MDQAISDDGGAILATIAVQLQRQGYDVIPEPQATDVPQFLRTAIPDLVAERMGHHLACMIVPRPASRSVGIEALRRCLVGHPEWQYRAIYYQPSRQSRSIPLLNHTVLQERLDNLPRIFQAGGGETALVMGWSLLEAAGRSLMPQQLTVAQSPAALLEALAMAGHILPSEADWLRELMKRRNVAVHGGEISFSFDDLTQLQGIIQGVICQETPLCA